MPFRGLRPRRRVPATQPMEIGSALVRCTIHRSAEHPHTAHRRASREMWCWCGSLVSSGATRLVRHPNVAAVVRQEKGSENENANGNGIASVEIVLVHRQAVRVAIRLAIHRLPRLRFIIAPTQVRQLPLVCSTIQTRIVVCACPVDPLWYPSTPRKRQLLISPLLSSYSCESQWVAHDE